ncbi:hypothetical protein [Streptomyces sp. SR-10]|uniref:hypothetical protein n=1 Tax=Streptomyces sp. SR-10 TaxID=3416442 RepID=UPI003CF025A0
MAIYQGPAVLVTDEGSEITIGADLRSRTDGREEWMGRLLIQGEHWDALKNRTSGYRLRLPSGKEGAFLRTQTNDRPQAAGSPFFYSIVGDGDAPF